LGDKAIKIALKAEKDADNDWSDGREKYISKYTEQYKKGPTSDEVAAAKKINSDSRMILAFKRESMKGHLEGKSGLRGYNGIDPQEKLLSEILGTGTLRLSDRQVEISAAAAEFIAVEAIAIAAGVATAGAATVAINAAVYGRHAYRL
jgi:hypothetical protein